MITLNVLGKSISISHFVNYYYVDYFSQGM